MTNTANLALPYILAAQAQKHVTHNEALRALDCIVQLSVLGRVLTSPPVSPDPGSRYIIPPAATGDWTGRENQIAAYQDGTWAYFVPREGWLAWIAGENILVIYSMGSWSEITGSGGESDHGLLSGLADDDHAQYHTDARGDARYMPLAPDNVGINATADSTNRLAMKSPASLFDNAGGGHQQKINKNAAGDTASQLYQTGYSGRAEIGLTGDDDFHFKVSPDGSAWKEAIKINKSSGALSFPTGQIQFPATQNPSSNANTLDDYEEGTFTPSLSFATPGDLAITYGSRGGTYTKIGRAVVFDILINNTSAFTYTTAASYLLVTGLPFACAAFFGGAGACVMNGFTRAGAAALMLETKQNDTAMYVLASEPGVSITELTTTDVLSGTSKRLFAAGSYSTV